MENIVKEMMISYLKEGFKTWGLEGTLEKLETLYSYNKILQKEYIKTYWELIRK